MKWGFIGHDHLLGPWESVRGVLIEQLEQIRGSLQRVFSTVFDEENNLTNIAIGGNGRVATRYVANTGPRFAPRWDQVNLLNGVKNRLPLGNFSAATPNTVLGRGSGSGNYQPLGVGEYLEVDSTTLEFTDDAKAAVDLSLYQNCGDLAWL